MGAAAGVCVLDPARVVKSGRRVKEGSRNSERPQQIQHRCRQHGGKKAICCTRRLFCSSPGNEAVRHSLEARAPTPDARSRAATRPLRAYVL